MDEIKFTKFCHCTGNCFEAGEDVATGDIVIRGDKSPDVLSRGTREEFAAFAEGIKAGAFDHLC